MVPSRNTGPPIRRGTGEGKDDNDCVIEHLRTHTHNSWVEELNPDPETSKNAPNKTSREVRSGHYVLVRPTPIRDPRLIIASPLMLAGLGLSLDDIRDNKAFVRHFSGDVRGQGFATWATPYALSIMGQRRYDNCPFGNGNGYGDGRAISIGEVVVAGRRWELQLKGAGRTPFCRSGDGRAVLRSSIREFLASEAMHCLGIETTRALSLITSTSETVERPWYSEDDQQPASSQAEGPDRMITEPVAITCRVAPSFLRVGHLDLYARRAERQGPHSLAHLELRGIVEHLISREYPQINQDMPGTSLQCRILAMLREFSCRLSRLVAGWIRVGYVQGNFNCDNCLAGGRTMDYGPFGFMERFSPLWNMWVGGGEHFGFLNQPSAAAANFGTMVTSVLPLLDAQGKAAAKKIHQVDYERDMRQALDTVWRQKFGFKRWEDKEIKLMQTLLSLLSEYGADWTLFWRQLAEVPGLVAAHYSRVRDAGRERPHGDGFSQRKSSLLPSSPPPALVAIVGAIDQKELFRPLQHVFYREPKDQKEFDAMVVAWSSFLREYLQLLLDQIRGGDPAKELLMTMEVMKSASPKYVPREWMLVSCYKAAYAGDETVLHELFQLFCHPYEEGTLQMTERYYKKAPPEVARNEKGGTSFMT